MGLERERWVHDDAVLIEEPEGGAVGICCEGVTEGGDARPSGGDGADGVVAGGLDEEAVSCGSQFSHGTVRGGGCGGGAYRGLRHSFAGSR